MGDFVRYAIYHDPATPANSSGWSGFPFPITYTTPPDTEYFPLILPLEKRNSVDLSVAQVYNRAKIWHVITDLSVTAGAVTVTANSADLVDLAGITTELGLYETSGAASSRTFAEPGGSTWDVTFLWFNSSTGPQLWLDGTDYRPQLIIQGTISATDGGDSITINFNSRPLPGYGASITCNVKGEAVTIYFEVVTTGTTSWTFTQLDFDPVEYWEYAYDGGGPVYDATTGLQV